MLIRAEIICSGAIDCTFRRLNLYRFSLNVPFLELDCPLNGATDISILHSLYNQAPKKAV
jgi:hypothetical protein